MKKEQEVPLKHIAFYQPVDEIAQVVEQFRVVLQSHVCPRES